jgi:hypothetical protein
MNIHQLWLCLALIIAQPIWANGEFTITQATTVLKDDEYRLNVQVKYAFSDIVLEALDNGVPLTMQMRIQVRHDHAWIWEDSLVDKIITFTVRYQPLTELYTVDRSHTEHGNDLYGSKQSFVTRAAAISALGEIEDLPLLKHNWLQINKRYFVHINVALDLESLPLPLRPLAHLTPSWNLGSGWTKWQLTP